MVGVECAANAGNPIHPLQQSQSVYHVDDNIPRIDSPTAIGRFWYKAGFGTMGRTLSKRYAENAMPKTPIESPAAAKSIAGLVWDIMRYTIVAVVSGVLIWYYGFYVPVEYVSREHTGQALGTHYIVKVTRFPQNASWNELAEKIQSRLEQLENMPEENALSENTVLPDNGTGYGKSSLHHIPEHVFRLFPQRDRTLLPVAESLNIAARRGLAIDRIAELLEEYKINDYLIELGHTVRSKGKKAKDRDIDWIVGIEKPGLTFSGFQKTFALKDQSLSTLSNDLLSVSVVAPDSMQANTWAAAMLHFGEQQGLDIANQHKISLLFLSPTSGGTAEVPSNDWKVIGQ